jgi:hypothetical protein
MPTRPNWLLGAVLAALLVLVCHSSAEPGAPSGLFLNPITRECGRKPTATYIPKHLMATYKPTLQPTHLPAYKSTPQPTFKPTYAPTHKPTFKPTFFPTHEPTFKPTFKPTHKPTFKPTFRPTHKPTFNTNARSKM